ncbi:MAG: SGNH/GDSL hydrolase family protein [Clostridia bacterium]|nr:SGNH/GDSL hydrolase family protein [Clostridia bacterium]
MKDFISYRKKMRILAIVSLLLCAVLAVLLVFLISDYNKKQKELSDELFLLDIEMYEAMKNSGSYFDSDISAADRELAEKLKNYNFYEKLKERLQVNVLFLGNGIVQGTGVANSNDNWVLKIVNEIETSYGTDLKGANYGKANTDAFYGYNIMNCAPLGLVYDLVVICYGAGEDPQNFEMYYDGLLRSIKNQNSKCDIYCIIEATAEDTERVNADAVKELCDHYGVICIDMNEYFTSHSIDKKKTLNGIIPNADGNIAYYNCISVIIKENLKAGRDVPANNQAYLLTSKNFDNYKYIKRADMEKVGGSIYEVSAPGKVATLMYYKSYTSGGIIRVYINGKKVAEIDNKLETNTGGNVINFALLDSELTGVNKIRIEVDTPDNGLNFYGVAFSGAK